MASVLIESAKILAGDELTEANILVDEGKIKSISRTTPTFAPAKKINAKGLIALPGMIDAHVHLRDLELSYKETFETGTQAAAVGGFTTVFDMPNTRPPTSSAAALARKIAAAEGHIYSNVAFQGALIPDTDELRRMVEGGAIAFKVYLNKSLEVFDSSNESLLTKALQAAKDNNALVTVHAEDGDMIRRIQEEKVSTGKTSVRDFLDAHPAQAEQVAVRRILGLSRQVGTRIHICHITLTTSVSLARSSGLATCEATAQHLLLNRLAFRKFGTLAICVPPIRPEPERRGLWSLFAKGQVD